MVKRTILGAMLVTVCAVVAAADGGRNLLVFGNDHGLARTIDVNGERDLDDNPFFQDLGMNGRRCVTCHQPDSAWSITPANVQRRFAASRGTDPIFRNNDGSNCEGALPQTVAEQRTAYSLLLSRGLIRVALDVPAGAEFVVEAVSDPYQCGPSSNDVSIYRRPLPSTNLKFISAVMWDGRESTAASTIDQDLLHQANDATRGHAQGGIDITPAQARQIVDFETGLFTAQERDDEAGNLHASNARGGAAAVRDQSFFLGRQRPGRTESHRRAVRFQGVHALRRVAPPRVLAWQGRRGARGDRARPGDLQHQADHAHGRGRAQRSDVPQRRDAARLAGRHLHRVPRRAERGKPLGEGAAEHRPDRA
jgi:hypothetical protein